MTEEEKNEAVAKLKAEADKRQREAEEAAKRLREELESPIDPHEAQVLLAETDVQRCQLRAYINDLESQIHALEGKIGAANAQMVALDASDAMTRRRMCNPAKASADV